VCRKFLRGNFEMRIFVPVPLTGPSPVSFHVELLRDTDLHKTTKSFFLTTHSFIPPPPPGTEQYPRFTVCLVVLTRC
jgi:hypothetical protein